MNQSYDIVIVGTGIGGLSTLFYLSETKAFLSNQLRICVIAKGSFSQTNTNWAQGGIAAVHALEDHVEKHIQDTMIAGAHKNNPYIVEKVIQSAPSLIQDLIDWGVQFDKNELGEYDLAKEGGHSAHRIFHKHDQTGSAIQTALLKKLINHQQNTIFEHTSLIGLHKNQHDEFDLALFNSTANHFFNIHTSKLVLATGGIGMLYEKTTNQSIATGDGIYFAHQLGAELENLSYVQFHPTGLYEKGNISFLITEALRGAGAKLLNEKKEAFMHQYDQRAELAPRDIVSRSILKEITQQNLPYVYLDATGLSADQIAQHFPTIQAECKKRLGIDIHTDLIPVIPTQHYVCGGVKVNEFGETTIKNLYAIGEIASTGLHGANRLASNSLLEAIAFAKFASEQLVNNFKHSSAFPSEIESPSLKKLDRGLIQSILSQYAGVIKSTQGLHDALRNLQDIAKTSTDLNDFNLVDFENNILLYVGQLLIQDAITQKENLGVFYNQDLV
jgi:L-aspartate oxidase